MKKTLLVLGIILGVVFIAWVFWSVVFIAV